MTEILTKILRYLMRYERYQFRFLALDGTESNKQIKVENSVEYEFINCGTSRVVINNFTLWPKSMQYGCYRIKLSMNRNEVDDTVYDYRFEMVNVGFPPELTGGYVDLVIGSQVTYVPGITNSTNGSTNLLQVVIKQKSS